MSTHNIPYPLCGSILLVPTRYVVLLCVYSTLSIPHPTIHPPHAVGPMYEVYGWYVVGMVCASGVVTRTPSGTVYTPVSYGVVVHHIPSIHWCGAVWSTWTYHASVGPT
jgi:hypothetical protein